MRLLCVVHKAIWGILTEEERAGMLARIRADRLAHQGKIRPADPEMVHRETIASMRLAGVAETRLETYATKVRS